MIEATRRFQEQYPGAAVGVLLMSGVINPKHHTGLERRKDAVEQRLRDRFAGGERDTLKSLPSIQAYQQYYKGFRKTYHVLLQLESVAFRGKPIPSVAALVEAMFMAELNNQLLTAGHDFDLVQGPVRLDAAGGEERFVNIRGKEETLKAGDMFIADDEGILSSVIYGPDRRTRITGKTTRALFTVYAPAGIEDAPLTSHLEEIRDNVLLVSPDAETITLGVFGR